MSESSKPDKKLKIVSLEPRVIFIKPSDSIQNNEPSVELDEKDSVIIAPFFIDREEVIDNLSELVDKVHDEFDAACKKLNLNWEAELELGMEFGVKFTAKLKISPKSSQ